MNISSNNSKRFYDHSTSMPGWVFNIICVFYFIFLSPIILNASVQNINNKESFIPWLGITIIILSVLEVYAFPKKMKFVHHAVLSQGRKIKSVLVLWMFHALVSIVIFMMSLSAFGYEMPNKDNDKEFDWWVGILFFVIVIKELYLLASLIGGNNEDKELEKKYSRPNNKEWFIDIILLAYACISYTICWETMVQNMDTSEQNIIMQIVYLFVMSILFFVFYLPLRIPYYVEEIALFKNSRDLLLFIGSLLLVLFSSIVDF